MRSYMWAFFPVLFFILRLVYILGRGAPPPPLPESAVDDERKPTIFVNGRTVVYCTDLIINRVRAAQMHFLVAPTEPTVLPGTTY